MILPPSTQNDIAAQIAHIIRLTTTGYKVVVTPVGHVGCVGHPKAAIVAIAETGQTNCTAKIAVYSNRIVYASATGTHVSYPARQEDAGRIVYGFLSMEHS